MVFRRKAKRYARRFFARKTRRTHSSSGMTPMNLLLGAAIYGAARPYVANMLPNMFQFGPVDSDNAIIGVAGYMGMKQKNGLVKGIATAALAGEAAMVASKLVTGTQSQSSGITPY